MQHNFQESAAREGEDSSEEHVRKCSAERRSSTMVRPCLAVALLLPCAVVAKVELPLWFGDNMSAAALPPVHTHAHTRSRDATSLPVPPLTTALCSRPPVFQVSSSEEQPHGIGHRLVPAATPCTVAGASTARLVGGVAAMPVACVCSSR